MENSNNGNYGQGRQGSQNKWDDERDENLTPREPDHNMSSGSAYLEEEVDRASHDMSGGHDYMENNGNSASDYNLHRRFENDFDGGSHSQEMRSDNDDFNDSGFDDESNSQSRTFNESEETWNREKRNAGTKNNNWDANDPMQRGIHDDEDQNSGY